MAQQESFPLSVEAYHLLGEKGLIPEKTELVHGVVFHNKPKAPYHCYLIQRLVGMLRPQMPEGMLLWSNQPIRCSQDSEPEADISIIRGKDKDFWDVHPSTAELVMEICVTSEHHDRSKAPAYAAAGIKEFWLVLSPQKKIEVLSNPRDGCYGTVNIFADAEPAQSAVVPSFAVIPSALFDKEA